MMKPAAVKVMLQLLLATQLLPLGQHWRARAARAASPDSVTLAVAPVAAEAWLRLVLATPLAVKVSSVLARAPPLVARVTSLPVSVLALLVQGLLLSAQAVTLTLLARQLSPVVGRLIS